MALQADPTGFYLDLYLPTGYELQQQDEELLFKHIVPFADYSAFRLLWDHWGMTRVSDLILLQEKDLAAVVEPVLQRKAEKIIASILGVQERAAGPSSGDTSAGSMDVQKIVINEVPPP